MTSGRVVAALAAVVLVAISSHAADADYVAGLDPRGDNYLSLRTGPGSSYREIRRLGPDTVVNVEARDGNWLKVRLQDGESGWVFGKYVAPGMPQSMPRHSPDPQTGADVSFGIVSGLDPRGDNYLSLRGGPSSNFRETRRLGPGSPVFILGRKGDWYRIELMDGMRGWAFSKYITPQAQVPGTEPETPIAVDPSPPATPAPQPVPPTIALPPATAWTAYQNPRFGTQIEYPADLFNPLPPPANSDGLSFRSIDEGAEFIVFGQFNALEKTIDEMIADDLASGLYDQVTYQRKGHDWYVLSGYRRGKVFYRKVVMPAGADVLHVFEIDYPPGQKPAYDAVTARMAQSLRAPTHAGTADAPTNPDGTQITESPSLPVPAATAEPAIANVPASDDLRSLLRAEFLALTESIR